MALQKNTFFCMKLFLLILRYEILKNMSMKKLNYLTIVAVIMTAIFAACTADITTIPMGVRLNHSSVRMMPGDTLTLIADVMPDEAAIKTVTWNSSNPNVATIVDGVVNAIAEGSAFISVTTNSGQKLATCELSVVYPVSSVMLDQTMSVLPIGKSAKLTATVFPYDAPNKSVIWESSAPDVAEVNEYGIVTAKTDGTAIITVITEVGFRIATCTLSVSSENYISMIWQPYENASIFMAGSGTVDIDWGDGSAKETITLSAVGLYYSHSYSSTLQLPCIVIINSNNNITHFNCAYRRLTSLDVSNNTALTILECSNNQLISLDVSNNIELTNLSCTNNQLASLDVSNNIKLTNLYCINNPLTSLDVSNTKLRDLNVYNISSLTSLDVSNNADLNELNCRNNRLTSLDVSTNTALTILNCSDNQLMSLDVRSNTALTELYCGSTQLTYLDISNNTALVKLDCWNNRLTNLDVSNNTALTSLNCSVNSLTNLDVSNNMYLANLSCEYTLITNLNVSANIALTSLNCNYNQLTNLDVSNNTALTSLLCINNQLTSLDVKYNVELKLLYCQFNQLSAEALNNLFQTLPDWSRSIRLDVSIFGNPGAATCNKNIAEVKGWWVH